MIKRSARIAPMLMAIGTLVACTSADKKAAADASMAENALNQGQFNVARQYAQRALAERDDVSEYWLLLAHIDVAANDLTGAFDAYENVLTLDRGNVEALTTLCQLGLAGGSAERAVKFADQLALVSPGSLLPLTVKAAAALQNGDKDTAARLLNQVFAKAPDDLGALIVQSKLLAASDRYSESAALIERSLSAPGNPNSRLEQLKQLYLKAGDRVGFERSVARLAHANPTDARRQLDYADLLYDDGNRDSAYAITRAALAMRPGDIDVASSVLNLWLKQGTAAMPLDRLTRDASELELEGKASYAQYANEVGRPDLAVLLLDHEALVGMPTPANSDAKAAASFAVGLRGARQVALNGLDAIIAVDDQQPRALLARARLRLDIASALADARKVLADDAGNVVARLTVANLLEKQGDTLLAETTLREGLGQQGGDIRVATLLARLLAASHEGGEESAMLAEFARANPMSLRAAALASQRGASPKARN